MFLIVFTTLMLSITAVFAQVATLQTAQVYRAQNALAQTMVIWHASSVAMIRANMPVSSTATWSASTKNAQGSTTGCTLTPKILPVYSSSGGNGGGIAAAAVTTHDNDNKKGKYGTASSNSAVLTPAACPTGTLDTVPGYLPSGYNTSSYRFYTLAYQDGNTTYDYIVTFVAAPATEGGNLTLPDAGGVTTSYTLRDLSAQLMRSAPQNVVFGTVVQDTAGQNYIAAPAAFGGGRYNVPDSVPTGAVAIVSRAG